MKLSCNAETVSWKAISSTLMQIGGQQALGKEGNHNGEQASEQIGPCFNPWPQVSALSFCPDFLLLQSINCKLK